MHHRDIIHAALLTAASILVGPHIAHAVPAFAAQTGQPCAACHIGAFGPQLTPFGRDFKIGGYTMAGGTGTAAQIPLAAMFLGSFSHTARDQSAPAAADYARNDNATLDQVSLFLAGRVNDHLGGFVQGTYDGVARQFALDNTDIRLTNTGAVLGQPATFGLSLNNSPGLSDPYNSTYPWGYPFVASALNVTPIAATVLDGALAGNSAGIDAYAWIGGHVYVDLGLYATLGPDALRPLGETYGQGSTTAPAPYARIAYEWSWGNANAHLGATVFHARVNPAIAARSTNGALGHDGYTDWIGDAGYQWQHGAHSMSFDARASHEISSLRGTTAGGGSSQVDNTLNDARATLIYYYQNTYGVTASWNSLWGERNPLLYAGGTPDFGSANGKPDTDALTLEADFVPFGKDGSLWAPFANLKLGVQYTLFTKFNGAGRNYDGFGRNAGDNNTVYLFAWTIF